MIRLSTEYIHFVGIYAFQTLRELHGFSSALNLRGSIWEYVKSLCFPILFTAAILGCRKEMTLFSKKASHEIEKHS